MSFTATCSNPNCEEHGVPKPGDYTLGDEPRVCGGREKDSGEPCNTPLDISAAS
jgi:hypothetical protein